MKFKLYTSKSEKKEALLDGLLHAKNNKEILNKITVLQNEISVGFNTKVVAIAGINDDELSAYFAKAFADAYSMNGSSSLIIDANLYNQQLKNILSSSEHQEIGLSIGFDSKGKGRQFIFVDNKTDAWCLDNEVYPSTVYKSGAIQRMIKENTAKYDHFILILPSLKDHKEISLLADVIESIVLVSQKDVTTKERIFDAIQYLADMKMPLAKTVVLK